MINFVLLDLQKVVGVICVGVFKCFFKQKLKNILICELVSMLQDGLTNILDRKRETIYSVLFVFQSGYIDC